MRAVIGQLRRRRGPLVRYWDADFNWLATEPSRIETWPAWLRRVAGLIIAR